MSLPHRRLQPAVTLVLAANAAFEMGRFAFDLTARGAGFAPGPIPWLAAALTASVPLLLLHRSIRRLDRLFGPTPLPLTALSLAPFALLAAFRRSRPWDPDPLGPSPQILLCLGTSALVPLLAAALRPGERGRRLGRGLTLLGPPLGLACLQAFLRSRGAYWFDPDLSIPRSAGIGAALLLGAIAAQVRFAPPARPTGSPGATPHPPAARASASDRPLLVPHLLFPFRPHRAHRLPTPLPPLFASAVTALLLVVTARPIDLSLIQSRASPPDPLPPWLTPTSVPPSFARHSAGDERRSAWLTPTPCRTTFRVAVPDPGASLVVGVALPDLLQHLSRAGVAWSVRIESKQHHLTKSGSLLPSPSRRRWTDLVFDLAWAAGDTVEVTLDAHPARSAAHPVPIVLWSRPFLLTPSDRPSLVLYLVDTLRADRVPPARPSSSADPSGFARLAEEGFAAAAALTTAPWTRPAVASLLTGRYPSFHRVTDLSSRLSTRVDALPRLLQDSGYHTICVTTNAHVGGRAVGLDRGFDRFIWLERPPGLRSVPASFVIDRVESILLRDELRGVPRLLLVHTMDPHKPYEPKLGEPLAGAPSATSAPRSRRSGEAGDDAARNIALYDQEVRYSDRQFGRFLRILDRTDLRSNAMIVGFSDHGEELLDHGGWDHGHTLYDELSRIPLTIRLPGTFRKMTTVEPLSILDVAPTFLDLAGIPPGDLVLQGKNLLGDEESAAGASPCPTGQGTRGRERIVFTELGWREKGVGTAARSGRWKAMVFDAPAPRRMLFDLRADPGERHPLDPGDPSLPPGARRVVEALDRFRFISHPGHYVEVVSGSDSPHAYAIQWEAAAGSPRVHGALLEPDDRPAPAATGGDDFSNPVGRRAGEIRGRLGEGEDRDLYRVTGVRGPFAVRWFLDGRPVAGDHVCTGGQRRSVDGSLVTLDPGGEEGSLAPSEEIVHGMDQAPGSPRLWVWAADSLAVETGGKGERRGMLELRALGYVN